MREFIAILRDSARQIEDSDREVDSPPSRPRSPRNEVHNARANEEHERNRRNLATLNRSIRSSDDVLQGLLHNQSGRATVGEMMQNVQRATTFMEELTPVLADIAERLRRGREARERR